MEQSHIRLEWPMGVITRSSRPMECTRVNPNANHGLTDRNKCTLRRGLVAVGRLVCGEEDLWKTYVPSSPLDVNLKCSIK